MYTPSRKRGWSLVEILIAIGIIAILISLAVPVVGRARANAQLAACMSNQRQIVQAILQYASEHRGYFPPSPSQHAVSPPALPKWGDPNLMQVAASPTGWQTLQQYLADPKILLCPLGPRDAAALASAIDAQSGSVAHSYYLLWNYNRTGPQIPVNTGYMGRHYLGERKGSNLLTADATREKMAAGEMTWYSPHSWGDIGSARYGLWKMPSAPPAHVVFNAGYVDGSVRRYTHPSATGHASFFAPSTKYWLPPERMD